MFRGPMGSLISTLYAYFGTVWDSELVVDTMILLSLIFTILDALIEI